MKNRIGLWGALVSVLALAPLALQAAAPGLGSVPITPPPGANVVGGGTCAVTTMPPAGIATQVFVASAANQVVQNINSQIAGMSRVLDADLQQLTTAQAQATDALYEKLEKLQLTTLSAQQMMENSVNFQSELSFPNAACGSMSQAAAMQIGAETGRTLRGRLAADFQRHRQAFNTVEARRQALDRIDAADVTAETLFPGDHTIDPAQLDMTNALMKAIVNPEPPVNLPAGLSDTASGRSYENRRKVVSAKQLPSEAAIAAVMTGKMPSISGQATAVRAMWEYMGGSGAPPGLTPEELISPDAFLYLQVASRHENPNWFTGLNERTPIGLQREELLIDATRLHLEYRAYELLQHIALLLAQMNGQQVQQMYGAELNELQQRVISTASDVRAK